MMTPHRTQNRAKLSRMRNLTFTLCLTIEDTSE
jgi:hypothetical protein